MPQEPWIFPPANGLIVAELSRNSSRPRHNSILATGSCPELTSLSTATSTEICVAKRTLHGHILESATVAERMSWAAKRKTTRPENMSYCFLEIFNIHMPLLSGEGEEKAFIRLQSRILKYSSDQSLLAWGCGSWADDRAIWSLDMHFGPNSKSTPRSTTPLFIHLPCCPSSPFNTGLHLARAFSCMQWRIMPTR